MAFYDTIQVIEERIGESLKDFLDREYVVNRRGLIDLSKKLGISRDTLTGILKFLRIPIRNVDYLRSVPPMISREQLVQWHVIDRISYTAISKHLNVHERKVKRWFKYYNIPLKNMNKPLRKPNVSELKKLFIVDKLSQRDIAKLFETSVDTVGRWLFEYDIPNRERVDGLIVKNALKRGFPIPSRRVLFKWYVTDCENSASIAKRLHTNEHAIRRWLKKYNIPRRSISESKLPKGVVKPSKEELHRLYVKNDSTIREIAAEFGVSENTIFNWIKGYDIHKVFKKHKFVKIDELYRTMPSIKQVKYYYVNKFYSCRKIAQVYSVDTGTIHKMLKKNNIPRRTVSETVLLSRGITKPSKTQLKRWYINERKSLTVIAYKVGVNPISIRNWLKSYNIPLRTLYESKHPEGFKKPSREELKRLYVKERKSTYKIAKIYETNSTAIGRWLKNYKIRIRHNKKKTKA